MLPKLHEAMALPSEEYAERKRPNSRAGDIRYARCASGADAIEPAVSVAHGEKG